MLNPRQEKIKHLVEVSTILDSQEKAEWLTLLELMNDKQLTDLESILATPASEPAKPAENFKSAPAPSGIPSRPKPIAAPKAENSPHLSHITNLPQGVDLSKASAELKLPAPMAPKVSSGTPGWLENLKKVISEKELPAPAPSQIQKTPPVQPPAAKLTPAPPARHPNLLYPTKPANPSKQEAVKPELPAPAVSAPKPSPVSRPEGEKGWNPSRAADAVNLNIQDLRSLGSSSIINLLQKFVRTEGYLKVLIYLEQSPLYKSYMGFGHSMLKGESPASGADAMAKDEFGEVADILTKIQVN